MMRSVRIFSSDAVLGRSCGFRWTLSSGLFNLTILVGVFDLFMGKLLVLSKRDLDISDSEFNEIILWRGIELLAILDIGSQFRRRGSGFFELLDKSESKLCSTFRFCNLTSIAVS